MSPSRMTPEQANRLTLADQHEWYRRLTSRRMLLRGGVAGAGALVAGPALLGDTATAASAATAARSAPASPSPWLIAGLRSTLSQGLVKEESVTRLLIAVIIGALLAVGGSLLTATYLAGNISNTPANAPLYNYGTG